MRGYLYCGEAGLVEKQEWLPNSWVNVECPDADDFDFLTKTLGVPESFLDDIADVFRYRATWRVFLSRRSHSV